MAVVATPYAAAVLTEASMVLPDAVLVEALVEVSSPQPVSAVGTAIETASPSITEAAVRSTVPLAERSAAPQ